MCFRVSRCIDVLAPRFLLAATLPWLLLSLGMPTGASAELLNDSASERARFATYVGMFNELSKRRQSVIYSNYSVSHRLGALHSFVHTTDGSVAFGRIDLFVDSKMPIVLRRVYHSGRAESKYFGASGWRFANSEQITVSADGEFRYEYGNGTIVVFDRAGNFVNRDDRFFTDTLRLDKVGRNRLRVMTRDGLTKVFRRTGDVFSLITVRDAFGNSHTYSYDGMKLKRIDSGDGAFVEFEYDIEGRVSDVIDVFGRRMEYHYDDTGRLDAAVDSRLQTWTYVYDGTSRLTRSIAPSGNSDLVFEYDERGRATAASENGVGKTFSYMETRTSVRDAAGKVLVFDASVHGTLRSVVNSLGVTTELIFNDAGIPRELRRNGATVAKLLGRRKQGYAFAVNGESDSYDLLFDRRGRLLARKSRSSAAPSFRARYAGQSLYPTRVARRGVPLSFGYDSSGRLSAIQGGALGSVALTAISDEETVLTSDGIEASLFFDDFGRLEMVRRGTAIVEYSYDSFGFRTESRTADGVLVKYNYDAVGNMFSTEVSRGGENLEQFIYAVNSGNRLESIFGSNGEELASFEYNDVGLPISAASTVLMGLRFGYDEIGRLVSIQPDSGPTLNYRYAEAETDIAQQHDSKTSFVRSLRREESSYTSRFERRFARTQPMNLGLYFFDDSTEEIHPIGQSAEWTPSTWIEDALHNSGIKMLLSPEGVDFAAFSKPSNRFFIPPEMESVNCCFCCQPSPDPEDEHCAI